MDQKLIGIIILVLSNINETESTEYYCTSEGNWTTTMTTCFEHGGRPASYRDLTNGTEVKVKRGTTVWTADYLFLDTVQDVPRITLDYDCGYTRLRGSYNQSSRIYTYTPTDVNYDICSRRRQYICENSSDIFEGWRTVNWSEAYSSCKLTSKYKLWKGYKSIIKHYQLERHTGFWVNSARRSVRATLSNAIPTNRHATECGTSKGVVKRGRKNICVQDLQAICISENKITDTRFSRSCLQDDNPSKTQVYLASTTQEPSAQPREISTTLSNSKTTTTLAYLSKQPDQTVTKIFNSKGTSKITAKLSSPSTFNEIFNSEKTTTAIEPSTKTKVISTEWTKLSVQSTDITTEIFSLEKTSRLTAPLTPSTKAITDISNRRKRNFKNGLSKTTIIIIVTAATAVIIGCIVTVILLLYFCRKRPGHKDANSHRVQFKRDNLSAAREFLGNNDDATNIASDENKAEVHVHHEACFNVNVTASILEPVNRNETENNEYHYVCNVPENPKPAYNSPRTRSISESEYDTTNNVKVVNESSNIYNRLGYETSEGVYDSTMSKPNRKPALYTNKYSKTSPRENLYDTTKTGVGTSRIHAAISPGDNIYSHA